MKLKEIIKIMEEDIRQDSLGKRTWQIMEIDDIAWLFKLTKKKAEIIYKRIQNMFDVSYLIQG